MRFRVLPSRHHDELRCVQWGSEGPYVFKQSCQFFPVIFRIARYWGRRGSYSKYTLFLVLGSHTVIEKHYTRLLMFSTVLCTYYMAFLSTTLCTSSLACLFPHQRALWKFSASPIISALCVHLSGLPLRFRALIFSLPLQEPIRLVCALRLNFLMNFFM